METLLLTVRHYVGDVVSVVKYVVGTASPRILRVQS